MFTLHCSADMIINSFASFFFTFSHKFLSSNPFCIYSNKILHPTLAVSFESCFEHSALCKACGTLDSIGIWYTSVANCYINCNLLSAFFSSLNLSSLYLCFISMFLIMVYFNLKLFAPKLSFYQKALQCCLQHVHCRDSLESDSSFLFYLLGGQ